MHRKLAVLAVTVAAAFGTLAVGLAGTAAADSPYTIYPYQVYGTGGYGLSVHTGPYVWTQVLATFPEGTDMYVECQTYGDPVTDPASGVTSSVWDQIYYDNVQLAYVSDLYVNTPGVGYISLSQCPPGQ
jgi:hypothetical protein